MIEPRDQFDLLDDAPLYFRYAFMLAMARLMLSLLRNMRDA